MKNFYSRSSTIALRLEFLIISSKYFSQCTYVFPQPFPTHKHTYPQSLYNLQFIVTKHILVEKEIKLYFPCFHSPLCSISCYSCFIFLSSSSLYSIWYTPLNAHACTPWTMVSLVSLPNTLQSTPLHPLTDNQYIGYISCTFCKSC